MADSSPSMSAFQNREIRLILIVLVAVVAILSSAYFWFLRSDYAVLTKSTRPEQAAAIVEELKKEGVPYELGDGGSTILVPTSKLDAAKLNISAKDLPLKGTVGFELFNQSDMGLTDFAQKVNYQRALQGEIERTIMAMDGISYARVHIALPERSLFRTTRSEPRAAVTLTPEPGVTIDADRIAGIQRLVAATVPDLALDQVAVLNERGQLLTPEFTDTTNVGGTASAIEANYAQRVSQAISAVAPRASFSIKVTTLPHDGRQAEAVAGNDDSQRDYSIRVVLFARAPLSSAEEQIIRRAVTTELSLNAAAGDGLQFSPMPEMTASREMSMGAAVPIPGTSAASSQAQFMAGLERNWLIALGLLGASAAGLFLCMVRRNRARQREDLVNRIRAHLLMIEDGARA